MTHRTPGDDDARPRYSRQALARLVLSHRAADLADTAANLVVTRYDEFTGPGGRASEAATLVGLAERVLSAAVVYERERDASWDGIARYLDADPDDLAARHQDALDRWDAVLACPDHTVERGGRTVRAHHVAHDPDPALERLDHWARSRLTLFDDPAGVSGALRTPPDGPGTPAADPDGHHLDLHGTIDRAHLELFLAQVSHYIGYFDIDQTDWDALSTAVDATDDAQPGRRHTHALPGGLASLHVTLARAAGAPAGTGADAYSYVASFAATGADRLAVRVGGATAPDLRLRVGTLLDVL